MKAHEAEFVPKVVVPDVIKGHKWAEQPHWPEARSQKPGVRSQESEVRSQKSEVRSQELEQKD